MDSWVDVYCATGAKYIVNAVNVIVCVHAACVLHWVGAMLGIAHHCQVQGRLQFCSVICVCWSSFS